MATYAHRHAESFQNYRTASSLDNYPAYAAIYPNGYSPVMTMDENDWEVTAGLRGEIDNWHWDFFCDGVDGSQRHRDVPR
ncbi:hypothetical protein A4S02_05980 [Acetobacter ascendens]|uniref:Uncharacterized protein n=1 Tax=Acetobacter ascendens TaxID=481146 RepID=A0A1D8QVN0_9PROT|nr:hypothetical protein A4S02_05980 [Acetobacter ascendens]